MNVGRAILTGIVLVIVFLCLQFLIHGVMLHDIYQQTASVWRPESDMQHLLWMMMLGEAFFAFLFAIVFAVGYDVHKARAGQGLRFGLLMALMIAPYSALTWYVILPIPVLLAVYWLVADFVALVVMGLVAGWIYKP